MNQDFFIQKVYKQKLTPLSESQDYDRSIFKLNNSKMTDDEINTIANTFAIAEGTFMGNKQNKSQKIISRSHSSAICRKNIENMPIQIGYGDGDTEFDRSQLAINGNVDYESIIECDQSKNYLQQTNNLNSSYHHRNLTDEIIVNKPQNLDELEVNEQCIDNRIEDNDIIDKERMSKMAETQQYIDDTFKNMIQSQKQQQQQQQLQQYKQPGQQFELPQCKICLEALDEEEDIENLNQKSQTKQLQNKKLKNNSEIKIKNGPLMSPCKCSGSSKYIHEKCLKEWIKQTYQDYSLAQCEICKQNYVQKLIYEKKLIFNLTKLCNQSKKFLTSFIIWLLLTHFFVISSIFLLIQIITPSQNVLSIHGNTISNTIIYILFSLDIVCDLMCIFIFYRYFLSIFRTKKLIDWQIMNFTRHPKEKHPKLIEKFIEGRILTKDVNSFSQRNVQLQLMMNNSLDNKNINNSLQLNNQSHQNPQSALSQSQHSRQKSSNGNKSNIQTINFFANMGVSEKILSDFLQKQDAINEISIKKDDSNFIMKRCDSEEGENDQKSNTEQNKSEQHALSNFAGSIKQTIQEQIIISENFLVQSEKLQTEKDLNNMLNPPTDDKQTEQFNYKSMRLGELDENYIKKESPLKLQRHVFFAKNEQYEIIVKPSDYNQTQEIVNHNAQILEIKRKSKKKDNQLKNISKTYDIQNKSNYQQNNNEINHPLHQGIYKFPKKTQSNSILQKVDCIIEVQEEEQDKQQQSHKKLPQKCLSFDSNQSSLQSFSQENNQKIIDNIQQDIKNDYLNSQISNIKENTQNNIIMDKMKIKQKSSQQKLQNILYKKIKQNNPEITSKQYIQNEQVQNKKQELLDKLFDSTNTQIITKVKGEIQSEESQIYKHSYLPTANHISLIQNEMNGNSSCLNQEQQKDEHRHNENTQSQIKQNTERQIKLSNDPQNQQQASSIRKQTQLTQISNSPFDASFLQQNSSISPSFYEYQSKTLSEISQKNNNEEMYVVDLENC